MFLEKNNSDNYRGLHGKRNSASDNRIINNSESIKVLSSFYGNHNAPLFLLHKPILSLDLILEKFHLNIF